MAFTDRVHLAAGSSGCARPVSGACIEAERREKEDREKTGYVRHELRVGSFSRVLPLPEGASEADIEASYKDGILEMRVPAPEPKPAAKIPVAKS